MSLHAGPLIAQHTRANQLPYSCLCEMYAEAGESSSAQSVLVSDVSSTRHHESACQLSDCTQGASLQLP